MKHRLLLFSWLAIALSANPETILDLPFHPIEIALSGAQFTEMEAPFSSRNLFVFMEKNGINAVAGNYPLGMRFGQSSVATRHSNRFTSGLSYRFLNYGQFAGRDYLGNETEDFFAYEHVFSVLGQIDLGIAQFPATRRIAASVHLSEQKFADSRNVIASASLGFQSEIFDENTTLAVIFSHAGMEMIAENRETTDSFPGAIIIALGRKLQHLPLKLESVFDWDYSHKWTYRIGGTFQFSEGISGRIGLSTLRFDQTTHTIWDFLNATSAGFGIHREKIHLDYGISFLGGAGTIQSVSWTF